MFCIKLIQLRTFGELFLVMLSLANGQQFENREQLEGQLLISWNTITNQIHYNLINSMKTRVEKVLLNRIHINY